MESSFKLIVLAYTAADLAGYADYTDNVIEITKCELTGVDFDMEPFT